VPLASVRVISSALFGSRVTAVTNDKGQFRLPELPPADYGLEIESPGFATYHEEGIHVGIGATIERNVILQVAGGKESINVAASASSLDTRKVGLSSRFGSEQMKSIPVRRYSMFDFIRAAPGVSPTSPSSGNNNSVSVFGGGVDENAFLLDGTNFTCPCSGGAAPQPDVDVIEEVQVESLGAPAEYGNIQGAVFNVVTKQGSNEFQYDASYFGQTAGLTSQPVGLMCANCSLPETRYTRVRYRDFTTHLGGPILRDRVWFFGGYQYLRDYDSQPGTDPNFPRTDEFDKIFWKITAQITPKLKVLQSFHDEFWVHPDRPTLSNPFETTVRTSGSRPTATLGHLIYTSSSNTLWEAGISRFHAPQHSVPSTGNTTISNHLDLATNIQSGGPQMFGSITLTRTSVKGSVSHYRTNLLSADHEFKAGAQFEDGHHDSYMVSPSGVLRYVDNGGPFQAKYRGPFLRGGKFITGGLFLEDSIRVRGRLTVNLGARFDHSRAISPALPARDDSGHTTGATINGLGTLFRWGVVSPRLGFAVKLTADGKTVVRTSYGRFHQGILSGELVPVYPGQSPTITTQFVPSTGQYSTIVSIIDAKTNVAIDSHMRSPYSDQISLSFDRELSSRLAVFVAYVRKNGTDFIGWRDTGGVYQQETSTLPDGRPFSTFILMNNPADRRFLLTNPAGYFLRYNGMTVTVQARRNNGFWGLASYTLSKAEGLQASSSTFAGGPQDTYEVGNADTGGLSFGRDPNDLTNARGTLPNDRTHVLRAMGSMSIPRTGLVVAGNFQYLTGLPWAATTSLSLPQGVQRILLEPRGSRRLSSQKLLDLRLAKTLHLGERGQAELLLDLLNVFNSTVEEGLVDDNFFSKTFGRPNVFVDPRRAMLGIRFILGR
jgi:hypothetical protein